MSLEEANRVRLWTDFNDIENEDIVWADLDYAEFFFEEGLRVGQKAELFDGAGHECVGTIIDVDPARRIVHLKIDWQTWRSARYPRITQDFESRRTAGTSNPGAS